MTPRIPLVLCLTTALSASACGATSMSTPEYKRNPAPRERYEITVTVADAPGAFEDVEGVMHFEVGDDSCVPKDPVSGVRVNPTQRVPFLLSRIDGDTYRGVIHTDLMQDEDYHGLGLCKWSLDAVQAMFKHGQTSFHATAPLERIEREQAVTATYWSGDYFQTSLPGYAALGKPDGTHYRRDIQDELFTITIQARKAQE
ncbi:hypothetical protein [Vulcaniibacterium gelatinicum]|uniref:hypothetical protein n=1 Tax=Vulcaniibacterium gelatinicum TaxID=2598725 RepID=UPI0011CABDC6|nr:hypothetical protein [Vulcaniibacterium gelatinicum]